MLLAGAYGGAELPPYSDDCSDTCEEILTEDEALMIENAVCNDGDLTTAAGIVGGAPGFDNPKESGPGDDVELGSGDFGGGGGGSSGGSGIKKMPMHHSPAPGSGNSDGTCSDMYYLTPTEWELVKQARRATGSNPVPHGTDTTPAGGGSGGGGGNKMMPMPGDNSPNNAIPRVPPVRRALELMQLSPMRRRSMDRQ